MTLDEIRTYVRDHLDLEPDDLPNALLDVFIREGSRRVERAEKRWTFYEEDWTLTTVAADQDYSIITDIGADVDEIVRLRSTTRDLTWVGPDEADRIYPRNVTATGEPRAYSLWGDRLRLYPIPDAVYSIQVRGYRTATDWVTDGVNASPDMHTDLHNAVALWALSRAYYHQDDPEMAGVFQDMHEDELLRVKRRLMDTPPSYPMVINGRASLNRFPLTRPRYSWEV